MATPAQIDRMKEILLDFYEPADAFKWLTTPHPQLGGMDALTMIANGHIGDVLATLEHLDQGVYL